MTDSIHCRIQLTGGDHGDAARPHTDTGRRPARSLTPRERPESSYGIVTRLIRCQAAIECSGGSIRWQRVIDTRRASHRVHGNHGRLGQ
jgi:hypothetical protein